MIIVLSRKDDEQPYLLHAVGQTYEDLEKCINILNCELQTMLQTFTVDMCQEAQ